MYVADVQPFYTHGKSVDSTGKLFDIHMLYMTQRATFNLFKALNLDRLQRKNRLVDKIARHSALLQKMF
jgi:hypothetical protein